jgi:multicomponent Na+:H+ antiporter subunit B
VKIGTLELITAVLFDVGLFLLVAGALIALLHHLAGLVTEDDA